LESNSARNARKCSLSTIEIGKAHRTIKFDTSKILLSRIVRTITVAVSCNSKVADQALPSGSTVALNSGEVLFVDTFVDTFQMPTTTDRMWNAFRMSPR